MVLFIPNKNVRVSFTFILKFLYKHILWWYSFVFFKRSSKILKNQVQIYGFWKRVNECMQTIYQYNCLIFIHGAFSTRIKRESWFSLRGMLSITIYFLLHTFVLKKKYVFQLTYYFFLQISVCNNFLIEEIF